MARGGTVGTTTAFRSRMQAASLRSADIRNPEQNAKCSPRMDVFRFASDSVAAAAP
jgi:hypothetical protein